jgi:hypothetical protein
MRKHFSSFLQQIPSKHASSFYTYLLQLIHLKISPLSNLYETLLDFLHKFPNELKDFENCLLTYLTEQNFSYPLSSTSSHLSVEECYINFLLNPKLDVWLSQTNNIYLLSKYYFKVFLFLKEISTNSYFNFSYFLQSSHNFNTFLQECIQEYEHLFILFQDPIYQISLNQFSHIFLFMLENDKSLNYLPFFKTFILSPIQQSFNSLFYSNLFKFLSQILILPNSESLSQQFIPFLHKLLIDFFNFSLTE